MTNYLKDCEVPEVVLRWDWKDASEVMVRARYNRLTVAALCAIFGLARMNVRDVITKGDEELRAVRGVDEKGIEMFNVAFGAAIETAKRIND